MQDSDDSRDPAPEQAEADQNLGLMLQAARDALGVTIEDIAAELRIEPRHLRALEETRFEELGAPVFAKGYLKQYGQKLGLDYKELLSEYYRIVDPRDVEISVAPGIKLHDERQITIWIIAALALALLAVFLFVWWTGQPAADASGPARPAPATAPSEERASVQSALASVVQPRADPAGLQPAEEAIDELQERESSDSSAASVGESSVSVEDLADASLAFIEIEFVEDSWAEITDARGERRFYGLGEAGTHASFRAPAPVRFFFGNADGVRLSVQGGTFAIPAAGRRGNLANFTVDGPAE